MSKKLGPYHSSYKVVRLYCMVKDILFYLPASIRKKVSNQIDAKNIKKIVVSNDAHLGDVLLTLRLISYLKQAYPNAKVDFVCGDWTAPLVNLCKDIDNVIVIDHWKLNRSRISLRLKMEKYITTWRNALQKLRTGNYDLAIDFYNRYPSMSYTFWLAGIRNIVGYTSGGGGPLLSNGLAFVSKRRHIIEYQADLLRSLGINVSNLQNSAANFRFKTTEETLLSINKLTAHEYIVFHIGSGEPKREWQEDKWIELARKCLKSGNKIIFTGAGKREEQIIHRITEKISSLNVVSLCNKLTLDELFQIIKNARFFVGCESFAGHIAAMYHVPQVSIMHGATIKEQWQPYGNNKCIVVRANIACLECESPGKCKYNHRCMDISVMDVIDVIFKIDKRNSIHNNLE
ncbi:glycosyltransferase family 9 protein [Mitsuokella multacida]|uniref:Glycosyltransferase family 9 protein n=1 Tax=Mitsuokella multacida TaxID=52226 RepID=A0A414NZ31_9FIRM|nr:glycosyltransferase family 9 protein [Mitsuokella multacida]RHF52876.1 glycosyltransferase family 9 protein [Mitsuokella multacida]